jgi:hypothetical protein
MARDDSKPQTGRNLLAEWREDYRLARLRNETGVEPDGGPIRPEAADKPKREKSQPKREKDHGIDIPF